MHRDDLLIIIKKRKIFEVKKLTFSEYKTNIKPLKTNLKAAKNKAKIEVAEYEKKLKEEFTSKVSSIKEKISNCTDIETIKKYNEEIEKITEDYILSVKITKKKAKKRALKVMAEVGIPQPEKRFKQYPFEFSGGMRQRIVIAIALIADPEILICDEPISALDVSIRAQIINLLNDLKKEYNLSIIFIAHDLSVVKYFCDRICVMYFGKIVEEASSDELFSHPLHPYTKALLSAIPRPDPKFEKSRKRIIYIPQEVHDYSKQAPTFKEIVPGHKVLCNDAEFVKYKEELLQK